MNQILSVEMNKKKAKNKVPVQIEVKKILIFFAVILLIFGLIMAGKSILGMVSNKNTGSNTKEDAPNITTSKQGSQLIVTIKHNKEITKMEYNWNNGTIKEVPGDGSNYLETTIEVPSGNNVLNITTTDIGGKRSTFNKEFLADPDDPQLTLEEAGTKIKIKAKDNDKLTLITYRWDDGEEHEIEIPEDSSAQIEKEIDLEYGNHILTVVAVNSKNRQVTKTQEIKVLQEPKVEINVDDEDRGYVILTAIDEMSLMKEMQFFVNEDAWRVEPVEPYVFDDGAKIEVRYPVKPGNNEITVIGINSEGIEKKKTIYYTYDPPEEENNNENQENNNNQNDDQDNSENGN